MRITVERPLRLRWEVTDETLAAVAASKASRSSTTTTRSALSDRSARRSTALSTTDRKEALAALRPRCSGSLGKPPEKAILDALAVRDPDAPVDHDRRASRARPRPARQRERPASRSRRSRFEADPTDAARTIEYRTAVEDYIDSRGAALRARRLGRPRQDQDRLRDPAHPALLQVRAAAAARGDRRRDQGAGGRDPGAARRGDGVSHWTTAQAIRRRPTAVRCGTSRERSAAGRGRRPCVRSADLDQCVDGARLGPADARCRTDGLRCSGDAHTDSVR